MLDDCSRLMADGAMINGGGMGIVLLMLLDVVVVVVVGVERSGVVSMVSDFKNVDFVDLC